MAKKQKFDTIKISAFYEILRENLETALEGKVSIPNTKIIYKTVMDTVFDVLKAMQPFQKINLTTWLEAARTIHRGAKTTPFERINKETGETYIVDYRPARSAVRIKLKGIGKNEINVRLSDEEAEEYIATHEATLNETE